MLDWKTDKERALDIATKTAIPFLIYSPSDYRDELVQILRSLILNCSSPTNEGSFESNMRYFEELIKAAPSRIDGMSLSDIHYYQGRYESIHNTLKNLLSKQSEFEKRLNEQENQIKSLKKVETSKENRIIEQKSFDPEETVIPLPKNGISNRDIVLECIRKSKNPVTVDEISEKTSLTEDKVQAALSGLRTRKEVNDRLIIGSIVAPGLYKGQIRNMRMGTYFWKDNSRYDLDQNITHTSTMPSKENSHAIEENIELNSKMIASAPANIDNPNTDCILDDFINIIPEGNKHFENPSKLSEHANIELLPKSRKPRPPNEKTKKVYDFLKQSEKPVTAYEISDSINLSLPDVTNAITAIKRHEILKKGFIVGKRPNPGGTKPFNDYCYRQALDQDQDHTDT
jgi:predicted transcriptional regulator